MKTYVMIILVLLFAHWSLPLSVLFLMLLLLSVVYPENPNIGGMMPLVVYHVVPVHYLCYLLPYSTVVVVGLLRIHG
jgi:hypothetical protein